MIETGKKLAASLPDVDIQIPVSGPFSILSNLIGLENLVMESITAPNSVRIALEHLYEGQINLCQEIINNGLGISFFESGAAPPLISPHFFCDVLLPILKKLFRSIEKCTNRIPAFIIGGDVILVLEYILETGTNYIICPAETNQKLFMKKLQHYPDVMVRINMNTNVLVHCSWDTIKQEVDRVIQLANNRRNS